MATKTRIESVKIKDIVRWNGGLYSLVWIKPSSGVVKICNPNRVPVKHILVNFDEIEYVGRMIDSETQAKKLYKKFLRRQFCDDCDEKTNSNSQGG